jgi:hypothetical protein
MRSPILRRGVQRGPSPEQIEAILAGVPDLCEAFAKAEGEELAELFDGFDVAVNHGKSGRKRS